MKRGNIILVKLFSQGKCLLMNGQNIDMECLRNMVTLETIDTQCSIMIDTENLFRTTVQTQFYKETEGTNMLNYDNSFRYQATTKVSRIHVTSKYLNNFSAPGI